MTGKKRADLAAEIGCAAVSIDRYCGGRLPSRAILQRIIDATNGDVTPNDWFDMPKRPRAAERKARASQEKRRAGGAAD